MFKRTGSKFAATLRYIGERNPIQLASYSFSPDNPAQEKFWT